jgi:4-hydroxy-tetrahydrodipicolinate synthase
MPAGSDTFQWRLPVVDSGAYFQFGGSYVATVTPMAPDGQIEVSALERLSRMHVDQGTSGIVVAGTTGEGASLDADEYQLALNTVSAAVDGAIPVIAGVGAAATAGAVKVARLAAECEVDALLCVTPYYLRSTQEGLYRHYCVLADAVQLPLVLYNVPSRTGVDLLPETVARLAERSAIVAIKEAVAGAERVQQLRAACGPDFAILSGDDGSALEALMAGACGVISVTANAAPAAMAAICELAGAADMEAALELNRRLDALHRALMTEPNPIPIKWVMSRLGWMQSGIRLPLLPATPTLQEVLEELMNDRLADLFCRP